MNAPDPVPPPPPEKPALLQKPDTSSTAAVLGGAPLAAVTVWAIENLYLKPRNLPLLDSATATAFGAVGAVFFGELWNVAKRLLDRIGS